jgi:protein-S-isoprenylcysteine O-methyltransferase Ste14
MPVDAAHKRWWQIFEVVAGLPFLIAVLLLWVFPLSFPRGLVRFVLLAVGATLILAGLTLVVLARREFAAHGQPTDPGHPTGEMITTGVFSISRNPLYLGGMVFLAGVSLAFNLPWALILLLPTLAGCQVVLIAPEERYLAVRFGEAYRAYAASVHRWLGRRRGVG